MVDFEQVEDRMMETLKNGIPYLRTVETYAGQLEDEIPRLPAQFPAVYVVYAGSRFDLVDGTIHEEKAEFSVLVAAKDARGGRAARKDDSGAYGVVKDVLAALTNETFGLDIERLRPLRTSLVLSSGATVIYGIDFQTSFDSSYKSEER